MNEQSTRRISLGQLPPVSLFGQNDANLRIIRDTFGSRVVARGNEILLEGPSAEVAAGVTASVEVVVFTTPTEAWFRYDLVAADGSSLLVDRFGIAVQTGGVWKITRATICQDLRTAGGDCGESDVPAYDPVGEISR